MFILISPICYIIDKSVFKHVVLLMLTLSWLVDIGSTITYDGFGVCYFSIVEC